MFKKLLSETIIYGIGAILPRVITFLLNPFYIDNFEGADDFAKFVNLYAIISVVNIVLTFGIETAYFRFSANKDEESKTFNTSYIFLALNALTFLVLVLIFNKPIANVLDYQENPEYIRWFAWIAFFDTLCVIPFAWLRFNNKPIQYSAIRVGQSILQTLLVLGLFLWVPMEFPRTIGLEEKVAYPFFSNVIGSLAGFVLLLPIALKVRPNFDVALFKRMIAYSWPIMIAGFAFMINENFDKIVQRLMISPFDAGAYGGSYKLAALMTLFVTAYRLGIEPYFFKQMEHKDAKKRYAQVTEYFVVAGSIIALGLIANLDWLKDLFIRDPSYWIALDIIPIIVIANLFFGIYYNLSTWYKVTDRTHFGTYISWIGAIITLLLNLLLLPIYGFMISAWATLIAYFCMAVLSYFLGQRYYPIPYKKKKILFYLTLCVVLSVISYVIFDANYIIGNIFLLSYLGMTYYIEKRSLKLYED
ncbi:oligosaccharide flippase family protein [Flavobacteriaceae bacterium Ap0902]|nr:oligosaccharide flippase family protein [Flavobacteriaceae bacterium Ap0902]